ncbi:MAG TPA: DUF1667 domain-containing protein [Firmicutes bacterium]|nr:DUF1667 domain-containing protein [Bacillota bacterium]
MSEVTNYLCIGCPIGCRLTVEHEGEQIKDITGFACRRGRDFAEKEHTDPRRVVTTTVTLAGGQNIARLPVKSEKPVRKSEVPVICQKLQNMVVQAPVRIGQVVLPGATSDGINVVATRHVATS